MQHEHEPSYYGDGRPKRPKPLTAHDHFYDIWEQSRVSCTPDGELLASIPLGRTGVLTFPISSLEFRNWVIIQHRRLNNNQHPSIADLRHELRYLASSASQCPSGPLYHRVAGDNQRSLEPFSSPRPQNIKHYTK